MGIFGRLTGWDQQLEAKNALLASHFVANSSADERSRVAKKMVELSQNARGGSRGGQHEILAELSDASRITQMNFVAVACGMLMMTSKITGVNFEYVANPYKTDNYSSLGYIPIIAKTIKKQHGVHIEWPGNEVKEDFLAWL